MKKCVVYVVCMVLLLNIAGCGEIEKGTKTEVQLFAAASLNDALEEAIAMYEEGHPKVSILLNADSSGTLMTQIKEGYACDLFFSASSAQMDSLEQEQYVIENSRVDLLKNQVVLITYKGSNTKVTGFDNMQLASSMALADASVPVGNYTRNIMARLGLVSSEYASELTSKQISDALNGIEINECSNVSKVKENVKEHNNEIGTVYYSDAYSVKEEVTILAIADEDLSGKIVYPLALIKNGEASPEEEAAAEDFLLFLQSEEALQIFEKYQFLSND